MFSGQSFEELLKQKKVRFFLAAICAYLALAGAHQLLTGTVDADWLRGGGNLLLWGGLGVSCILKAYDRTLAGINIPINIGVMLIVASWIVRM